MPEILAWNEVMERLDNDQDLFFELVDMFFASYPNDLEQLRSALDLKDVDALKMAAHAIKSALGNLGAMQCHARAYELENIGKSGNFTSAASTLSEFEKSVAEFKTACMAKRA